MSNLPELDEADRRIVDALRADSRQTLASLSRKARLPRSTVHERIRRLRAEGAIRRFTIESDYARLGLPSLSFILASYDSKSSLTQRETAERLAKVAGVQAVYIVSGEWDLLVKLRASSTEEAGRLIMERVRAVPGIGKTYSMSCFHVAKDEI
ncbi:putative HTH-type transcriptional regulator [uncultured archaeon]|nr:putative HTH-type transcriptional regulator [uncultured archaeon]